MATQEEHVCKPGERTPAGGVRSIIYYQDKDGSPCEKAVAVAGELVEYDARGKDIRRTYVTFKRRKEATEYPVRATEYQEGTEERGSG
jgi:hypothetical protein